MMRWCDPATTRYANDDNNIASTVCVDSKHRFYHYYCALLTRLLQLQNANGTSIQGFYITAYRNLTTVSSQRRFAPFVLCPL